MEMLGNDSNVVTQKDSNVVTQRDSNVVTQKDSNVVTQTDSNVVTPKDTAPGFLFLFYILVILVFVSLGGFVSAIIEAELGQGFVA